MYYQLVVMFALEELKNMMFHFIDFIFYDDDDDVYLWNNRTQAYILVSVSRHVSHSTATARPVTLQTDVISKNILPHRGCT